MCAGGEVGGCRGGGGGRRGATPGRGAGAAGVWCASCGGGGGHGSPRVVARTAPASATVLHVSTRREAATLIGRVVQEAPVSPPPPNRSGVRAGPCPRAASAFLLTTPQPLRRRTSLTSAPQPVPQSCALSPCTLCVWNGGGGGGCPVAGAPPRVTFRRVVAPLRGPGQSPALPFACCVGSLRSVGRCGRCSRWCRFRVRGAQSLVCWDCAGCGGMCRLRVSGAQ